MASAAVTRDGRCPAIVQTGESPGRSLCTSNSNNDHAPYCGNHRGIRTQWQRADKAFGSLFKYVSMLLDTNSALPNFKDVSLAVLAPQASPAVAQQVEANVGSFLLDFRRMDDSFLAGLSVTDVYIHGDGTACPPPSLVDRVEAAPSTLFVVVHEELPGNAKHSASLATKLRQSNVIILSVSHPKGGKIDNKSWDKVIKGKLKR